MTEIICILFLLGVVLTFIIDLLIIHIQTKKELGQIQRELGPRSHRVKNKTPTLGGIGFVLTFCFIFLLAKEILNLDINYLMIIFPFVTYSLLGLFDDLIIIISKKNDGIGSTLKLFIQILIAAVYFYFLMENNHNTEITLFTTTIDIGFLYGLLILLLFTGFSNATNLTDGLDGLLGGCSVICLFGLFIISLAINLEVSIIILLLISTLFGFLIWNYPKAKIFMGNIGAYGIGAFIVTICIVLRLEIYLFIIGGIFILETLSVMLQVGYFKLTKGKRIFKMAPLHHHFEMCGYKEHEVLHMFYIIEIVFVYIAILLFQMIR
ncbi:MAG: phospho-N-acetylmuramoyl-pentapeptide-transferase [bacterium]